MKEDKKTGLLRKHQTTMIGSWIVNAREEKIILGDTTARLLGIEKNTFDKSFKKIMNLIHPDDRKRVSDFIREVLKTKKPGYYSLEHRIKKKSGEVRILSQIMRTGFDEHGRLSVVTGTVSDVTEQRLAEKALQESEARYRSIFECSLAMLITVDQKRRITGFNPEAVKKLGYTPEEMINQPISIIYDDPRDERRVNRVLKKDGKFYGRIKNRKKSGEVFTVQLSAAFLYDTDGKKIGTVGSSLEVE